MATTTRYTLLGTGANFMDFYFPYGTILLDGQEIVFKGNSGVDTVYVGSAAGLIFDFTQAGLGIDQIYLSGNWADYSRSYTGSVVTITRINGGSETIKTISGDSLIFADGTVSVLSALNFLKGTATEPVPAGTTSTAFPMTAPGSLSNTVRAVVQDATGETIAMTRPGVTMIVKGGSGVDMVYVTPGANIDGTQLGLGQDKLYLTGNWADYGGTYTGSVVTLTRTVGADIETVKFLGGSTGAFDDIIFADGTARSVDILNYLKAPTTSPQPTLNSAEVTPLPGPTVTIVTNDSVLKIGDAAALTFTLSEAPANGTVFDATDITYAGGTLSNFAGSGTIYTATFTPTADTETTATVTVATGAFANAAGQNNSASTLSMQVDTLAPAAATINTVATNDVIDATERVAGVTVTGTNEAGAAVTLNGNAVTPDTATTWSYNLSAAAIDAFGQGSETLTIVSTDAAGNTIASTRAISVDTTVPTLASSTPTDNATDVTGNSIVLTFSEAIAAGTGNIVISDGTNTANIAVTDAAQVAISGNAMTVTPTAGLVQGASYNVQMASGVLVDSVGNAYAGIADVTTLNFTMTSKPTVQIFTNDSALRIGDIATLTFTLSAASTNFAAADVTVSGGVLSNFVGSGNTYTASFTPSSSSTATATVDVAAGVFTNVAAIGNLAASQVSMTVDTVAPVVAITSAVLTQSATPVVAGTAEAGSSITAVIAGATYTTTATGGAWSVNTATATPTSGTLALNANGNNQVSVTAADTAGNATATAATQVLVIDTTPPAPAIINTVASNDNINAAESAAGVTVAGTNETGATVTLNGNAVTVVAGTSWSYNLTTGAIDAFGQGAETLTVISTDAAGNTTNSTKAITVDTVVPVVAITSSALTKIATPVVSGTVEANSIVTAVIAGATYTVTATNGTWSVNTASATPISGTLSLNNNGSNQVSVTAVDAAGNATATAATQTLVIDTVAPLAATINVVATDDIIDAAERAAGVTVTGTNEVGATVMLNGNAVTQLTGTTWSYDLATAAIDVFGQGAETLNVVSTDAAGNTSSSSKVISVNTRSLSYSATTFSESTANDGSITTTSTITLAGGSFTGTNGQVLAGVNVTNVPTGLSAVVTQTSSTTATLSLTGNAAAHANANDIASLTVVFTDACFALGNAASVTGSTKSNLIVDFLDVAPRSLSYSATTFSESTANDGSITTTSTITLAGGSFTGTNGQVLAGVNVTNVPTGLSAVVTQTSSTTATLNLIGNAAQHANANDLASLTVVFTDACFALGNAAAVTGSTKSNLIIDFIDVAPRSLSYSATTFNELALNDGSIATTSTITLVGGSFTGINGQVLAGVNVTNVPTGLSAVVTQTSSTTATLNLTGNAAQHANANDIASLTVVFTDACFALGNAAAVTGSTKANLVVNFADTGAIIAGDGTTNILNGTAADNIIYGGGGADIISGGAGNDMIDITDAGMAAINSATIRFTSTANGTDTIIGFSAATVSGGGDVLDFSAIANLADSVATGQILTTNFAANNVFIFDSAPITIADAASAIAASASVVATDGYIVLADSANNSAVTVYHSTDLAVNGIETALVILSGVNIANLAAANFIV